MRYTVIAAISAALLSTSAFAQDASSSHQQNRRSYAPVATPFTPSPTFPSEQIDRQRNPGAALSEQDRLFLMQGDRGLGNG